MSLVTNTADGSTCLPRLRFGLSALTLDGLPATSAAPKGTPQSLLLATAAAGFEGLQTWDPGLAHSLGLTTSGIARVDRAIDARPVARVNKELGHDCATIHVGTGFESDEEAWALIEAAIDASAAESFPLYVETHRATVTQDMKRTLDIVQRFPEIRFTGDFSHWYTGAEMTYGDFDAKLRRLAPVFERVRFLHGRISDPGCIQIPIGKAGTELHVTRFQRVWTQTFRAFLSDALAGDYIWFCPELLSPTYFYARTTSCATGEAVEECDRWREALTLVELARQAWESAVNELPPSAVDQSTPGHESTCGRVN